MWNPKGFLHLSPHSVTARCRIHFTLDRSLFTRGDCMNKEQFNRPISTSLFSFPPPKCRKMEWKGMEKEGKIMWKKLQPSKEMFDIDFGLWRWSTEPNVCVCDKTGVNLSSEAESKDFFPQHWHYVLLLFSCYSITNIHFLPPRSYDLILSSGLLFGKPSFWNGREGLFVDLPLVKSQVGA